MTTSRRPRAPLVTGLGTLIAIALALPLLAPSCADFQPGIKGFAKGSLIIPMDVCYQYQTDQVRGSYTPSSNCPGALVENGDVIKAYGLVYQLIRNGVAVYWIINPDKNAVTPAQAALTTPDLTLQFGGGFPVLKYDWNGGPPLGAPNTSNFTIKYLGGPFIVDGSDAVRAGQILQKYKSTFRPTATTGVNVHVASIAFTASVAKVLAGGWSAGGATPPKLALLNIGSDGAGAKNSEVVIRGYLQKAGLDIAEPDPTNPAVLLAAGGSATGVHGTIYDRLVMEDFIPTAAGNVLTTNLFKNGYQILWVPHWAAPSSCSDCPPGTSCPCTVKYATTNPTYVGTALQTIGAYGAAGKDIFAECAGLGSFEGVLNDSTYGAAVAATHFQTVVPSPLVGALKINASTTSTPVYQPGYFASPLMQLGDYPFIPRTGAVQNYKPTGGVAYTNVVGNTDNTVRLISEGSDATYDIFTHRPGLLAGHGTYVYLGGHSYSGTDGSFEVGGTRLVLNTLFNLGAGCTESGVACDTGKLGKCGKGILKCRTDGTTYCFENQVPSPETCNGIDDNCDGSVDEGLDRTCYDGPAGTDGVGLCHAGVSRCDGLNGYTACQGQVLPQPETCNNLDDNCNGQVDENLTEACYDGPSSTLDPVTGVPMGACKAGTRTCTAGALGACVGQVTPRPDDCTCPECGGGGQDFNCDGVIAQCGACTNNDTRSCYTGPAGTAGVGPCHAGTQTCVSGNWSTCTGEQLPATEVCNNAIDEDCNGIPESWPGSPSCGECATGASRACYDGPAGTAGQGVCKAGTQVCVGGAWAACGQSGGVAQTLPGTEICDGQDNDCDGAVDDGAACGPGFACRNGVCVYDSCGPEIPCAEGYACVGAHCQLAGCGSGSACAAGSACHNGTCVDPNAGLDCGPGSYPAGGFCTGGACYEVGCPAGSLCSGGACVPNPCSGAICPDGTFCRQGDCVQACAFITCAAGQRCDVDGFCTADPCAGKTCTPSQTCVAGSCVTDPCAGLGCGRGQACLGGTCVDDPCTGVICPTGQCQGGQCYAVASTAGVPEEPSSSGCGCSTGGAGTPLALLALLALAPLARRRRPGPRSAALLGLLLVAITSAGCPKTEPFDPASCTAPGVGLTVCPGEERCVDLAFDPSHCGDCGRTCQAGQTCVDAVCGPSTSVAPLISSASPVTLNRGGLSPVRLDLTGQRFASGATVRVTGMGGTTTSAANYLDAGHLFVVFDLKTATPEIWQVRVVNPDRVISNVRAVPVVVPTPVIAGYSPTSHAIGSPVTVHLDGSGFMVDSACMIGGGSVLDQAVATTLGPTGLDCTVDLSAIQPGTFQLWVANPQGGGSPLLSAKKDFSATSNAAPTLTLLAPSTDKYNTVTQLRAHGTGFDTTSRVIMVVRNVPTSGALTEQAQATTLAGANELLVPSLDLTHCPGTTSPCPTSGTGGAAYAMKVQNGAGGATGELTYTIASDPPVALSLAPTAAFQGETRVLTVTGTSLPAGTVLQVQPPGGAFADAASPGSNVTSAWGTVSLVGAEAGGYLVRLKYSATSFSASFSFTVMSNTAVLVSISPSSAMQGQFPVTVTLKVSNLQPPTSGVTVRFSAQANELATTPVDATTITTPLDLRNTVAGPQTLQVRNPNGAALSGPATFTVTPGPPTLSSLACTANPPACPDPTHAARQVALVPITLTGTNFAAPDVTGANGSAVHVFAGCTPVVDGQNQVTCTCPPPPPPPAIPPLCVTDLILGPPYHQVTVTSPTRIDLLVDTTAALPGAYSFWVWNPGGSPAPQRSNRLVNAFTVTP